MHCFAGVVTSWADPAVTADNSSPLPDQPVTFYYRSSSSGTTSVITEYLSRACPEAWTFGSGQFRAWRAGYGEWGLRLCRRGAFLAKAGFLGLTASHCL